MSSLLKKDVEKDRFENKFNAATLEIPDSSVDQIGNLNALESGALQTEIDFRIGFRRNARSLSLSLSLSLRVNSIENQLKVNRESINN